MAEDPKYTIKKIVDDITTTIDDDSTPATLVFQYAGGPQKLKELFQSYDVVVTFSDARVTHTRQMQDVPEHHPEKYPVNVYTIDKYTSGVLVSTADLMQHKMKEQMRTVIEAAAKGVGYRLRILTAEPNTRRIGGIKVWVTTYFILYTDD